MMNQTRAAAALPSVIGGPARTFGAKKELFLEDCLWAVADGQRTH